MDAERREVMLAHAAVLPLAGVAALGAVEWVVGRGVGPVLVCEVKVKLVTREPDALHATDINEKTQPNQNQISTQNSMFSRTAASPLGGRACSPTRHSDP